MRISQWGGMEESTAEEILLVIDRLVELLPPEYHHDIMGFRERPALKK